MNIHLQPRCGHFFIILLEYIILPRHSKLFLLGSSGPLVVFKKKAKNICAILCVVVLLVNIPNAEEISKISH